MKVRTAGALAALLAACAVGPTAGGPEHGGTFSYSASNAEGKTLVVGKIVLTFTSDSTVSGTWELAAAPGVDPGTIKGSQLGTGELRGSRVDGKLLLNLNPGYADNNVTLEAAPASGGYSGTWSWSSFAGPQAGGKFKATRAPR